MGSVDLGAEFGKVLDRETVFSWHSDLYADTEFDLSKGALGGPFGSPFPVEGGVASTFGSIPRGISISRTTYSVVGEASVLNDKPSIVWFAADTPATSVYVPYIQGSSEFDQASSYKMGLQNKFSRDSAYWAFSFVNNFAKTMWSAIYPRDILPLRTKLQKQVIDEVFNQENGFRSQKTIQQKVVDSWWDLADLLPAKYNDQYLFFPDPEKPNFWSPTKIGYSDEWAKEVGLNQDPHPVYVKRREFKDLTYTHKYTVVKEKCPVIWDDVHFKWLYAGKNIPRTELAQFNDQEIPIGLLSSIAEEIKKKNKVYKSLSSSSSSSSSTEVFAAEKEETTTLNRKSLNLSNTSKKEEEETEEKFSFSIFSSIAQFGLVFVLGGMVGSWVSFFGSKRVHSSTRNSLKEGMLLESNNSGSSCGHGGDYTRF